MNGWRITNNRLVEWDPANVISTEWSVDDLSEQSLPRIEWVKWVNSSCDWPTQNEVSSVDSARDFGQKRKQRPCPHGLKRIHSIRNQAIAWDCDTMCAQRPRRRDLHHHYFRAIKYFKSNNLIHSFPSICVQTKWMTEFTRLTARICDLFHFISLHLPEHTKQRTNEIRSCWCVCARSCVGAVRGHCGQLIKSLFKMSFIVIIKLNFVYQSVGVLINGRK